MKKGILILLVGLLWCGNANADWTFAYTEGTVYTSDYYYDKETITKK